MTMATAEQELNQGFPEDVAFDEPMSRHTSLRVGGPADMFVRALNLDDLVRWIKRARRERIPYFILGRGTNILVADQGIRGIVFSNLCQKYWIEESNSDNNAAVLYAESGASLPGLAQVAARRGWAGLEWAIGIPGAVGGAVVNNAGALGGSMADVLRKVVVLDESDLVKELPVDALDLRYRGSRFKGEAGREVVLSAEFSLKREPAEAVMERMEQYAAHRRQTQPNTPSVGSIFKNPAGDYAGQLIDEAGLKGTRVGGAEVSQVHANFFVNRGEATAQDVLELIRLAQKEVHQQFDVRLELEIELVGEW